MVVSNDRGAPEPRIVGRYALFDEIAAGGMATIHLGRLVGPVGFSRTVAIKTLHPQFAKDPEFLEMFMEEARLASRIQHPNVISTLDVATTEGEVFLVMEYIAGESLAKLVRAALKRGERVPVDIAATILAGMLHGLHATHEAKNEQLEPMHIVHRDVSPQNVLVGLDGIARIFDFGVAKAAAMRSQSTSDGQMKGKLSYMSPEQLNSKETDRRTDVFAAGVVAWECLTGRRLFAGQDPGEVLAKVLTLDIPAPIDVESRVPQSVSDSVMRALERSVDKRWQTARDFAIDLERTMTLAAAHVVGEWVETHASEALQDRRLRVESVERDSVDLGRASALPPLLSARPNAVAASAPVEASEASSSGSGTSRTSNLTVSQPSNLPGKSRAVAVPLALGAAAAAVVAMLWYWQQGGLDGTGHSASPASLPVPLPDSKNDKGPTGSEPKGPDSPAALGSEPPVVHIDSLPEQRSSRDAGANPATAERATTLPPQAPPAAGDSPPPRTPTRRSQRRAARAASKSANAQERADKKAAAKRRAAGPSSDEPADPKKAGAPAASDTEAAPATDCQPPWYIDERGIQRVKPHCM